MPTPSQSQPSDVIYAIKRTVLPVNSVFISFTNARVDSGGINEMKSTWRMVKPFVPKENLSVDVNAFTAAA